MRRCRCGCGASLDGRRKEARYATAACRTRDWKRRHGLGVSNASVTSQSGHPRSVELRVALRKAERHAEETRSPEIAREVGEVLREVLTDRQRERLATLS